MPREVIENEALDSSANNFLTASSRISESFPLPLRLLIKFRLIRAEISVYKKLRAEAKLFNFFSSSRWLVRILQIYAFRLSFGD